MADVTFNDLSEVLHDYWLRYANTDLLTVPFGDNVDKHGRVTWPLPLCMAAGTKGDLQ